MNSHQRRIKARRFSRSIRRAIAELNEALNRMTGIDVTGKLNGADQNDIKKLRNYWVIKL